MMVQGGIAVQRDAGEGYIKSRGQAKPKTRRKIPRVLKILIIPFSPE
jgi:hypothetical protein